MDRYQQINQQFLSDQNIQHIKQQTGGTNTFLKEYTNKFINYSIIRNNDFNLNKINDKFIKWIRTRSFEPLINEIMTKDDADVIDYDSLKYKKPWLRSNFDVNMFDLLAQKSKRQKPLIYNQNNRYVNNEWIHSGSSDIQSIIYKDYTYDFYKNNNSL